MNQQQLIDLEVERRALIETVRKMSKEPDARMETGLDDFLSGLEKRVAEIQNIINQELQDR